MGVKQGIAGKKKVRNSASPNGSTRLVLDNHLDNQSGKTD